MPSQFSSARYAIAECDRCGFRYKLTELKNLVIKTKNVSIKVCPTCWEPDQPQLQLGLYPVNDPQAIRDPRKDLSYYAPQTGSRIYQWGWNPVGYNTNVRMFVSTMNGAGISGSNSDPIGVTNDLVGYGKVGQLTAYEGSALTTDAGVFLTTDSGVQLTKG